MALIKCPSCKNTVSNESYCCPRCGKSFRAMRLRRLCFWLMMIGAAGWAVHRYVHPLWPLPFVASTSTQQALR